MKKLLFILICFTNFSLLAQIPTQKLVAFFPFNNNAIDSSGNGNHGQVFGATLTKDRFGNPNSAYYFDGNDYILVKDDKSLRLKSLSYSGWYNFENT